MKITIVIPVYNVEAYIEDCLKSVAAQTYKGDIECIIVDDCTPDGSCTIIEHFIKDYDGAIEFKLLHHTVNRGLSAARNTGIDAATGEYVYFLDSDDEITPDCIELLAAPLKKEKYDFVIGDYTTIGHRKGIPPLMLEDNTKLKDEDIRNSYLSGQWYVMAVNKLCNIEFIRKEKLNFKEGLINEDEIWSFQLACTAKSMYVVKKETYKYKIRISSIMGTQNNASRAYALAEVAKKTYDWAIEQKVIYKSGVLKKILSYREASLSIIFSIRTYKERKSLYLKCHNKLRIAPFKAYKNNAINKTSLIKELYNYMPGILGYHYLRLYNFVLGRQPFNKCL